MTAGLASSMAAVPSRRPVPIEPPTATMFSCAVLSWWRSPDSGSEAGEPFQARGMTIDRVSLPVDPRTVV